MYNTYFKVKYHDIEQELILKLTNKTEDEPEVKTEDESDVNEYSSQDISDVCYKLYIDELCSVFYAENIIDNKIDQGMKTVFAKMIINSDFKSIIDQTKALLSFNESPILTEDQKTNLNDNSEFIIILTLFSRSVFYITHKCICQQLAIGLIDNELLDELKKHTIRVLTN